MTPNYDDFNDVHLDVLRELGNIGAGNAATSLSILLDQAVMVKPPEINLLRFEEVPEALGGKETLYFGVLVSLSGDINGIIMFLLDTKFAHLILNILTGKTYTAFDELDDMALSVIREVGNVISGAYVNSISEMTGLQIKLSVPYVSIDMAGALLSVPIIQYGALGDKVLFIEENFSSDLDTIVSHMVLFAEVESLNLILDKLGIK